MPLLIITALLYFIQSPLSIDCKANRDIKITGVADTKELSEKLDRNYLGSGSYGDVYKLYLRETNLEAGKDILVSVDPVAGAVPVAMKLFKDTSFKQANPSAHPSIIKEKMFSKLQDESNRIEAINKVDDAVAPTVYYCGESLRGLMFIIMEYVDTSLDRSLKNIKCELNLEERLDMLIGVSTIVARLHENFIAHCDIKPSNIGIFEASRKYKLLDLGIAKINERCTGGTMAYMAPEIKTSRGVKAVNGMPSDVYSLGIMFWDIESNCNKELLKANDLFLQKKVSRYEIDSVVQDTSKFSVIKLHDRYKDDVKGLFYYNVLKALHIIFSYAIREDIAVRPSSMFLRDNVSLLQELHNFGLECDSNDMRHILYANLILGKIKFKSRLEEIQEQLTLLKTYIDTANSQEEEEGRIEDVPDEQKPGEEIKIYI